MLKNKRTGGVNAAATWQLKQKSGKRVIYPPDVTYYQGCMCSFPILLVWRATAKLASLPLVMANLTISTSQADPPQLYLPAPGSCGFRQRGKWRRHNKEPEEDSRRAWQR